MTVTFPSGAILINAFGLKSAAGLGSMLNRSSALDRNGKLAPMTSAPPAMMVAFKNERLSISVFEVILFTSRAVYRSHLDRIANPVVSSAPADHSGHRFVDIVVGRLFVFFEEYRGGHYLPGLAVSALGNIDG